MSSLRLSTVALLAAGCKKVEPIPQDLDSLLHDIWARHESASDPEMADRVAMLETLVEGASLEKAEDGSISDLTQDDVADLGTGADPAKANGVYMVGPIDCSLSHLETILSYPDQDELYEDVYDSYERTLTADRDAWLAHEIPVLTWSTEYAATILGATYDANVEAALRYVAETDEGPAVLAKTYFPEPATFPDSEGKSFDQDYQLEIYYEKGGHIVHVYAMWRQVDFGSGFTSEDESVQRILLNNLISWDEDTNELCAEGRP